MSTTVVIKKKGPGCLGQVLWFVFVGSWASQLWIVLAYLFSLTVIGLPLTFSMLHALPRVIALRAPDEVLVVSSKGTSKVKIKQRNIFIRAIYFLLIGWWLTAAWLEIAWFFCAIIIGMPLGFKMFDMIPALLTLKRTQGKVESVAVVQPPQTQVAAPMPVKQIDAPTPEPLPAPNEPDTKARIDQAVQLAKAGHNGEAQAILTRILKKERDNARAWATMSMIVEEKQRKVYCLQQVLRIKPDNEWATKQLEQLKIEQTA